MSVLASPTISLVTRYRTLLVLLAVLTTFGVAAPPHETFGSSNIEHAKDILAFLFGFLGLTFRCLARSRNPDRKDLESPAYLANLLILFAIFLMHGNVYVVTFALVMCATLWLLFVQKEESATDDGEKSPEAAQSGATLSALPGALVREWRTVTLTIILLLLTEVYEELPEVRVTGLQVLLLAASGIVMALSGATLFRDSRHSKVRRVAAPGPHTLGLRVDGRVRWVDRLENMISLGNLDRILSTTLSGASLSAGDRLLDVGCGSGHLAIKAASVGRMIEAVGIDATPGMIDLARKNARRANSAAQFYTGVGEQLPFPDGAFDAVASTYFLHHLPSAVKRRAVREMWRVLAPGGRLVIADYGTPTGVVGQLAAFPMRFNFHEHVRGQLAGELEAILAAEKMRPVEKLASFLGYINVIRVVKPG